MSQKQQSASQAAMLKILHQLTDSRAEVLSSQAIITELQDRMKASHADSSQAAQHIKGATSASH